MIILRQKTYSSRFWAGTKGAAKGAGKGAMYGAVLAPGKIIAHKKGKDKLALGIAGAGAVIGGIIGGKLGYKEGVHNYDLENNPEIMKKERAKLKRFLDEEKNIIKADVKDFDINSWKTLKKKIDIPEIFLKYVSFYKNIWSKKIDNWYNSIQDGDFKSINDYSSNGIEFKRVFPVPISAKDSEYFYNIDGDGEHLTLCTINEAGDDGWLTLNLETSEYGWDYSEYEKSLGKLFLERLRLVEKGYDLNQEQKKLVQEFRTKVINL
jgi:hypothetical protein